MENKIQNIDDLEEIIRNLREQGKIIITTNGSFDILHAAHINLLEKAKQEGDILVVLLNSDQSIKKNKGEMRPIVLEQERAKMLSALESVDYVIIFNEDKPLNYLERLKPHKHVKGGSVDPERMKEEREFIEGWGGSHVHLPLEEGYSTTNIIETILERHNGETNFS